MTTSSAFRFPHVGCVAIALALSSLPVRADIQCSGTLSTVHVDNTGNLLVNASWRGDYTKLCNLSGTPTEMAMCASWFAIAKQAVATGKSVATYYYDTTGTLTCATLPTYGATPVPAYLMLKSL